MADGNTPSLHAIPVEIGARKRVLRTFVPLRDATLDAGTNSGWAHVAMLGEWRGHSAGSFAFTQEAFAQILKNFGSQSNPIPWDYEHDTFSNSTTGPKPASGWVRKLELRNNGTELWAFVDWTPRAAQMIRDGEYRYCSPVVDFESTDRRSNEQVGAELLSVALTNNPFLDGQHPLQLNWVQAAFPPPQPDDKDKDKQQPPSAEPKGPPAQHAPPPFPPKKPDEPQPMAAQPPPPPDAPVAPPSPEAAAAAVPDGAADANAFLDALADASGLDKAQTLAALLDMKDMLINAIQKTVSRDGTPAEATRTMSDKKPETPAVAAPSGTTPAVAATVLSATSTTDQGLTLDELERRRDKELIQAMQARLDTIERERAAEKAAAIVQMVDEKIKDGFVTVDQRDNAIWAFTQDRARAEQIYAQKLVPIGTRQSVSSPGSTPTTATPAAAKGPLDMSQFSRGELMTIDCLMGARKTQAEAVEIVLKRRAAIN